MILVTAGIIRKEGKILIARRREGKRLAGLWEFPGGKIEENESHEHCLKREIKEELGIHIKVLSHYMDSIFNYPNESVCLLVYWAEYLSGEISLTDHDEIMWLDLNELNGYIFAPADRAIVNKLVSESFDI